MATANTKKEKGRETKKDSVAHDAPRIHTTKRPESTDVPQGMPLVIKGYGREGTKILFITLPIAFIVIIGLIIVAGTMLSGAAFYVILAALIVGAGIAVLLTIQSINRAYPVAFSENGILVDTPGDRFDIPWSTVTGMRQRPFCTNTTVGADLLLGYTRGDEQRTLHLGTVRVGRWLFRKPALLSDKLARRKILITESYDAIIAYAVAKGVKLDAPSEKEFTVEKIPAPLNPKPAHDKELFDAIDKAKAEGRVKIVRR